MNYLSYKSRTEKEVCDKLRSYGEFDEAVISQAVGLMKELGYVDDRKYAELFVCSKTRNKLDGFQKIKQMLIMRGIDPKTANDAIAALNEADKYEDEFDEAANAVRLIEKKTRGKTLDYTEKKKIYGYLRRKGYSFDIINEAFKRIGDNIEWE